MSTPQGPRESGNNRGRGRGRGTFRTRGGRNEPVEEQQSNRRAHHSTRGSDLPPRSARNAPPKQNEGRSSKKRPREAGPPSAVRNRGQRPARTSPAPPERPQDAEWRNPMTEPLGSYQNHMDDLYQTLKKNREQERKDNIRDGTLADPQKPTSLANAITTVGTCPHMCPEFERVERIVQSMVDGSEKSTASPNGKLPDEKRMVKRFRRAAAGFDEQLPSDIRPPRVLQMTLNYLFDQVIGDAPLAIVHKFVWDRTRSIRNDFSIQRVTKLDDLKVAIDCFERIARFHILSLHQLSQQDQDNGEFDHHQEREQLNNTLLSLIYYYDDSRSCITSANEAEFRAYCIIFEIQDQRPDLEDRVQNWPRSILDDARVQIALKIHAAAGNTSDEQGPLRPRTSFSIAQAHSGRFWALVQSKAVPYIMACVAEIYFDFIRSTALQTIWTAYKVKRGGRPPRDWVLGDLIPALGFDNEDQTRTFCEDHGLSILEKESGEAFVDLGSVTRKYLIDSNSRRKQIFSRTLVEPKRMGRTLPAVINGLSVSEAQTRGLVQDPVETISSSGSNHESLFITGHSDDEGNQLPPSKLEVDSAKKPASIIPNLPFGTASSKPNPFEKESTFGLPTPLTTITQPSISSATLKPSTPNPSSSNPLDNLPKFNFWPNKTATSDSSASPPTTAIFAAPPAQEPKAAKDSPDPFFKIPLPFQTDPKAMEFASTPPSRQSPDVTPQVGLAPSAQATKSTTAAPTFQWPKFPDTTIAIPAFSRPSFEQPKAAANEASQSDPKIVSLSEALEPPTVQVSRNSFGFSNNPRKTEESGSLFDFVKSPPKTEESKRLSDFLNDPPRTAESKSTFDFLKDPSKTAESQSTVDFLKDPPKPAESQSTIDFLKDPLKSKESRSPFGFPKDPPVIHIPSTSIDSKPASPNPAPDGSDPSASQSKSSSDLTPLKSTPTLPKQYPIQPATESSNNSEELASGLISARQPPSSLELKQSPFTPMTTPAEQAKVRPPKPDPRPAVLEQLSTSLMMDEDALLDQFVEYTLSSVVKSAFHQVKDEQSWKRAGEVRAILLSKKYYKKWKKIAWARGLRRSKQQRRKLAQSMREMAKNTPQQQDDLGRSLLVDESGRGRQQTDAMAPPSRNKRKSLSDDPEIPQQTPEAPVSKKQRRDERTQKAQLFATSRIENHHNRSKTLESPISSSRVRGHSKSLNSFRPDFSHLGDGSILSHSVLQKARHLVPCVKTDTTRTDYFLLKSLGIDPNTTLVPRTNRKRPRDERQPDGIKMRKPSPPHADSHAGGKSSANGVQMSTSTAAKTSAIKFGSSTSTAARNSANIFRPLPSVAATRSANNAVTSAAATSSSTTNGQLSRSAPAASANVDSDSYEELFAQARAVRETMKQDMLWFRTEREKCRLSATTSSSGSKSRKHNPPRKETEKQRRLREFKSTPSRTEQRLKLTKANGLLPPNWSGFGEMRATIAGKKAARSPELAAAGAFMTGDETEVTDWEGEEETSEEYEDGVEFEQDYEYANTIKGNDAKGSSFDDAIEL